jgi:hypothetical protein
MALCRTSAKPQADATEHDCDISGFSASQRVYDLRIWEKFGKGVTWLRVVKGMLSRRTDSLGVLFVPASLTLIYNHGDHLVFMSASVRVPPFRASSRVHFS